MRAGLKDYRDNYRTFGVWLLLAMLAWIPTNAQALFKVPGTHVTIQEAIDACPATGCVITLTDPLYKLSNSLLIYEKSNLTLKGATNVKPVIQFQDAGLLAGPFFSPADAPNQPAGWKQWPMNSSTAVGGSQNTTSPYSPSGYQHNGAILIKQSSKITLDNLVIDGVAPKAVGHLSIWMPAGNPTLLGNFGVNLFLSKEVDVKNTKIINCFAGIYIYGRNKGGAMARNNAGDLDKAALLPNSQFGYSGEHTVEYSELANNIWGVYVESDWDLGTSFHHNLIYNNYNTKYAEWMKAAAGTSADLAISGNSEAANHPGGFMYGKDFVTVPYKIYNNTFYQCASIFGYGMWRATTQHVFYNNLITSPYFDYNSDKSGLLTANFSKYFLQQDLMAKYSDGMFSNTFSIFPARAVLEGTSATPVPVTRQNAVFPMPRLDLQLQTQKRQINFLNTAYTPPGATTASYIKLEAPVVDTGLYWSGVSIQYQANERHFPYQSWILSGPAVPTTIPKKQYTTMNTLRGVVAVQTNLPAGVNPGDTIPVLDQPNSQTWMALDSAMVLNLQKTFTDTLGMILATGAAPAGKNIAGQTNWFSKSIPFQSVDPTNAKFLEPVWTDYGVDSVVLDHGRWGVDPDGSIVDVGAKSKSKGLAPAILINDGTQAKYDSVAQTIRFNYDIQELGGNFISYQYLLFTYASSVSDDDTPVIPYNPIDQPLTSIISGSPKPGSNTFEAKLSVKPDARSRYQIMVVATTASGQKVYSNMGIWLYKNDGFDMNVLFFDPVTKQQISSTRVGQKVIMTLRPVISRDAVIRTVDKISYFCYDSTTGSLKLPTPSLDTIQKTCVGKRKAIVRDTSWFETTDPAKKTANVYKGTLQVVQIRAVGLHDVINNNRLVDPTDLFRKDMVGEQSFDVIFTTAGPQVVGANGKDTVGLAGKKASFSGDGKILVRPGLPYLAQFQDPPSVSLADTGFIAKEARYPVKLAVFDSMGNLVDTACDVNLEITAPNGGISALGGNPIAKTLVLHLDSAHGSFLARSQDPVGTIFWLKSKLVVRDSARVKVTPPQASLKWTYAAGDSIFRYLGQTAAISLTLLDGSELPAISTTAPPFAVHINPGTGLKLALASSPTVFLDSVIIDRKTAMVDLIISTDAPVTNVALVASSPDLNDPATFQPINFVEPPVPPYPSMDSASLRDSDCDGAFDEIRVYFKPDPKRRLKDSVQVRDVIALLPSGTQVLAGSNVKVLDADSSVISVALTTPIPGTTPTGKVAVHFLLKRVSLGDTSAVANITGKADTALVAVDRVGPRLVPQALIWENPTASGIDTLRIVVSEPVKYSGSAFPLLIQSGATWIKSAAVVTKSWTGAGTDTLYLEVSGNKGEIVEKAVVRIDPVGGLVDALDNPGSDCIGATDTLKAWVKPVPMVSAYLVDANGDGSADSVVVKFGAKLTKTAHYPDSLVVSGWCVACANISIPKANLISVDGQIFGAKIAGLPKGATRGTGALGQGGLTFKNAMQTQAVDLIDSVGPIATLAKLHFGTGTDTLMVTYSEPLVEQATGVWMSHEVGGALALTKYGVNATADQWTFTLASSATPYPNVGDSILLPNAQSRLVAANTGTIPTTVDHPPRVVVQGGDKSPDSAWVLDRNGDGTADAVRLFYTKAIKGNPTFSFTWNGATVRVDSLAYQAAVAGKTDVTIPVAGFGFGTSGAASATSQSFVAGAPVNAIPFVLKDGVAPVLMSAFVSYGVEENAPDTIRLKMSEAATLGSVPANLVLAKRKGGIELIAAGLRLGAGDEFVLVCQSGTCSLPGFGDSARLAKDAATDPAGAVVGEFSRYVPVFTGAKPIRYKAYIYPKGRLDLDVDPESPLRKLDPVSLWVRSDAAKDSVWTALGPTAQQWTKDGGKLPFVDVAKGLVGVKIELNASFDGQFMAYDNMGVFVGKAVVKIDLADLQARNLVGGDNKFSLLVTLNGMNTAGKELASSVYMIRVIGYSEQIVNGESQRSLQQNRVFKVGVYKQFK